MQPEVLLTWMRICDRELLGLSQIAAMHFLLSNESARRRFDLAHGAIGVSMIHGRTTLSAATAAAAAAVESHLV